MSNSIKEDFPKVFKAHPELDECDVFVRQGQIFCHDCREPLQMTTTIFGKEITIPTECKCMREKREAEEAAEEAKRKEQLAREREEILVRDSDIGGLVNKTFDNFSIDVGLSEVDAYQKAKYFVTNFKDAKAKNSGLFLTGNSGTGKTHLIAAMANALMHLGTSCYFMDFNRALFEYSDYKKRDRLISAASSVDCFFIDDIGKNRVNAKDSLASWESEYLTRVIDTRVVSQKPLVVSSNLDIEGLKTLGIPVPTINRIREMCPNMVVFMGGDYRMRVSEGKRLW